MTKQRLDKYLVETNQVENRSKLKNLIRRRLVTVNDEPATKPGLLINPEKDQIKILPHESFVSRSGLKLYEALQEIKPDLKDKICADIGASTGGFTEVLLQYDPEKIYAIDVGTDQMHPDMKSNPKVENHENINAREEMPIPQVDFMVADLSFISAHKYILNLFKYLKPKAELLLLYKPQFEVGPENLKPNGVVKDYKKVEKSFQEFESFLHKNKLYIRKKIQTKLTGKKGNQEYFILISR